MATYSRVKTWSSNETLTSSDLNAEFNNIITNTNSGALNSDNVSTTAAWSWTGTHTMSTSSKLALIDNIYLTLGSATDGDYFLRYSASNTALELSTTNSDGSGTNAVVLDIQDGTDDVRVRGGLSTDNNAAPTTGLKVGGNIISDTDSTDDLGTTSVRWANVYTDAVGDSGQTLGVKATTLSFDAAATIDTSGNNNLTLNAGTGTLVVTGAATTTGNVGIGNADIGTTYHAGNLLLVGDEHADTGDTSTAIVIATRVAGTGELNFTDSPTTAQQGSVWYDHSVDAMIFRANTGEKMRITSNGDTMIGTTDHTNKGKLGVVNSVGEYTAAFWNSHASSPYGLNLNFSGGAPDDNTTHHFLHCHDNASGGTDRLLIWSDGDVANHDGTYGTLSSEARLKQDITDARSYWDDFKKLRYKKFRMISDVEADPDAPYRLGLIADEACEIFPQCAPPHRDMESQNVAVLDEDGNATYEMTKKLDDDGETVLDEDGHAVQVQKLDEDGNPIPITESKIVDLGTTTKGIKNSIIEGPIMAKVVQELQARVEALEAA